MKQYTFGKYRVLGEKQLQQCLLAVVKCIEEMKRCACVCVCVCACVCGVRVCGVYTCNSILHIHDITFCSTSEDAFDFKQNIATFLDDLSKLTPAQKPQGTVQSPPHSGPLGLVYTHSILYSILVVHV